MSHTTSSSLTDPHLLGRIGVDDRTPNSVAQAPAKPNTAEIVKSVVLSSVIPNLVAQHVITSLAKALIGSHEGAAIELIASAYYKASGMAGLFATLIEPAARKLGDLWADDTCSEFDVTLGLCRLQAAIRVLTVDASWSIQSHWPQPVVLIAPAPGELHQLGAALDAAALHRASWAPQRAYPRDLVALQQLVSTTWFDALDLSLSTAFRRDHRLPVLAATITATRQASLNPAIVVVVGGRAFTEGTAAVHVGADYVSKGSAHVTRVISHAVQTTRQRTLN